MGESLVSTLTDLRLDVVDALASAGVRAYEYLPEVISPPVALVEPDNPYFTLQTGEGVPFGYVRVTLTVFLITGAGSNKTSVHALDDLIEQAFVALHVEGDWDVTEVSRPGQVSLNGGSYLGAVMSIQQDTKMGAN